ncbi:MAG: hypothetical protein CBC27_03815 [Opitutia bacterium TMED67]|jgi:hypothetical protein|nr:hypothetical protein [Verrucomicrobiales bacterium]OUU73317.1 MAG: hypothetical protein CBC27_03815 [Opitutae bacterium TMED67]
MKVSNMRELLQYVADKKKKRAHDHYEMVKVHGPCSGMGNRRYKIPQRSNYRKGKSFAYNGRWNDYNINTK